MDLGKQNYSISKVPRYSVLLPKTPPRIPHTMMHTPQCPFRENPRCLTPSGITLTLSSHPISDGQALFSSSLVPRGHLKLEGLCFFPLGCPELPGHWGVALGHLGAKYSKNVAEPQRKIWGQKATFTYAWPGGAVPLKSCNLLFFWNGLILETALVLWFPVILASLWQLLVTSSQPLSLEKYFRCSLCHIKGY